MKSAAIIAAALVTLGWLISRKSTDSCCPFCGWETDDDEPEC